MCPKDYYHPHCIDQLVDATSIHELLSFMDAYSGYKQIKMAEEDVLHTAFNAYNDIYHYVVMPFGLFSYMLGDTMEAYVDDILVKSRLRFYPDLDLERAFEQMKLHNVFLNPSKCNFGVSSEMFFEFMVSQKGIKVKPEKLTAIDEIRSLTCHKMVQCLNGRLAALGRFLSKSRDKSLTFFQVLWANKMFDCTQECEEAFQSLRGHLETLHPWLSM